MAASNCNISFELDYASSTPITEAIASYKISGSTDPYEVYVIDPVPASGSTVVLPSIETPGKYDLMVTLHSKGATTNKKSFFHIGECPTRTIFWNHSVFIRDKLDTVVNFSIKKNGVIIVDTTETGLGYIDPIEKWKSFTAEVGDQIEFTTNLIKSATGKTSGGMFTCTTTGKTGTVNVVNPTAPNALFIDYQHIGPDSGTIRNFAFTVDPGLNYALGAGYTQ
ncbi:hypothetical protein F3J23_14360 [Chryseobacterium sp. Tr-659]|uniref:hypothetical protein n=1 Tax=Chryseobacterium sp. Tr-659 TaxID=2608340 RepID=UPI00141F6AFB|nr:hypothetical protein [Chryseobacterium sp. Tr-659]NIF06629.1 hypothetical protein [Chryseobacterium sp. Tr-659]